MKTRVVALSETGVHYDAAGVARRVVSFDSLDGGTAGFTLAVSEGEFDGLVIGATYDVELVKVADPAPADGESTPAVEAAAPAGEGGASGEAQQPGA